MLVKKVKTMKDTKGCQYTLGSNGVTEVKVKDQNGISMVYISNIHGRVQK